MSTRNADVNKLVRSALWSAYGDVLGFPTELVDLAGVKRRIRSERSDRPVAWTRRVGGKFGVNVELPAGSYSDDTQLRLATSRAIRANGEFDVEAFSKVELPIWPAYALGGGRGTRAASVSLAKRNTSWVANFDGKNPGYINGGGNGVAMRIQPHVWAAADLTQPGEYLPAVIRNAICTHGHFRGIAGGAFHAVLLAQALSSGDVPGPEAWYRAAEAVQAIPALMRADDEIAQFWIPVWEKATKSRVEDACNAVLRELTASLAAVVKSSLHLPSASYGQAVDLLDGTNAATRGSGLLTSVLAAVAANLHRHDAEEGVLVVVNAIGTDTDSIGTMTGAILGAVAASEPKGEILDREYIRSEATRLAGVASRSREASFAYPDLLKWVPPKSQLDVVGQFDDQLVVVGLGRAKPIGNLMPAPSQSDQAWQFVVLEFGQTLLVKRRLALKDVPPTGLPYSAGDRDPRPLPTPSERGSGKQETELQQGLFDESREVGEMSISAPVSANGTLPDVETLHDATKLAWNTQLDPETIGAILLALAERENGIELAIAFAAIVAKAKKTQDDRERRT